MKQLRQICIVVLLVAGTVASGSVGAGPVHAARVPTVAVGMSGNWNWQITYDRGAARPTSKCVIRVGRTAYLQKLSARTMVLRGRTLGRGVYPVSVRCGRLISPTVNVHSPRSQLNDIGTWLSNSTAGFIGY